jgi:hypothetical protein
VDLPFASRFRQPEGLVLQFDIGANLESEDWPATMIARNYLRHFLEFVETQSVSALCLFNFHIGECMFVHSLLG